MRRIAVIALGAVAVAAAGVWALGQFGGSTSQLAIETVVNEGGVTPAAVVASGAEMKPAQPSAQPRTMAREAPPVDAPPPAAGSQAKAAPPTGAASFGAGDDQIVQPQSADDEASLAAPTQDEMRSAAQGAATPAASVTAALEAQVKTRKVTYNRPPKILALNKPVDISLVINATGDMRAADEALKDFKGEKVERDVDLSDFVAAELSGTGFDIDLQTTSPRQKLSTRIANQWRWRVTPTELGDRTLQLTIYGFPAGAFDGEPIDSYKDVIHVEVQQLDAIVSWAKGVQPIFAVLAAIAGVASAAFAFLRFRNEKKAKTPPA